MVLLSFLPQASLKQHTVPDLLVTAVDRPSVIAQDLEVVLALLDTTVLDHELLHASTPLHQLLRLFFQDSRE